jgi:hypothetical protein
MVLHFVDNKLVSEATPFGKPPSTPPAK